MMQPLERAARPRRRGRWTVAQRDDGVNRIRARVLDDLGRRLLRVLETQRQSAVPPRVLEYVAAVGPEDHVEADLLGGLDERPRLVAGRRAQDENSHQGVRLKCKG